MYGVVSWFIDAKGVSVDLWIDLSCINVRYYLRRNPQHFSSGGDGRGFDLGVLGGRGSMGTDLVLDHCKLFGFVTSFGFKCELVRNVVILLDFSNYLCEIGPFLGLHLEHTSKQFSEIFPILFLDLF